MDTKEDYFDDGPQPNNRMNDGAGDSKNEEMSKDDQPTFLINSEVCPDMNPGDTMELRIVATHEREYEVQYVPKESKDEEHDENDETMANDEAPQANSMYD